MICRIPAVEALVCTLLKLDFGVPLVEPLNMSIVGRPAGGGGGVGGGCANSPGRLWLPTKPPVYTTPKNEQALRSKIHFEVG